MEQFQLYTAAIAGQAVTLTPRAGTESHPTHLGASTLVFNTVANPPAAEFWKVGEEYEVLVRRRVKQ